MTGRRAFLGASAALLAAGCTRGETPHAIPGELLATHHALGHRLRDGSLPKATEKRKARVVIVGSGIAGLSAAWRLRKAGFSDFEILELEAQPGGNSRYDTNAVTRYPWGAHYIPIPTREARGTRELLSDLGVLLGDPHAEVPLYDERALCQAPQERLYRNGTWEEGLVPILGRPKSEEDQWHRFQERMREFKALRGKDGRRAFASPLELSSRDPALLALDNLTMDAWMRAEGFDAEPVHWVVNYACRDDYGCDYRQVSAWAGIHYFAARAAAAKYAEQDAVLTWPEGNGFVVRKLMERYAFPLTTGALVHRIEERAKDVALTVYLERERRSVEIAAEHVIWAAPFLFAGRALAGNAELAAALSRYEYAPWVIANFTLSGPPYAHHGAPLSWENVLYDSSSLGYVVATHQGLESRPGPTVLTWYQPLVGAPPREVRQKLLTTPRDHWMEAAFEELEAPHPEIRSLTQRVDVLANGHAMVMPRPGLIWGDARARVLGHRGRIHFAHADASGLSLFEEANDRGVSAANAALKRL